MKRTGRLAGLLVCLSALISGQGRAGTVSGPSETIEVTGHAFVPLRQTYRKAEGVFRRFNSYPASDRAGLTLHMEARLMPGGRPGSDSGLMIAKGDTRIPLFPSGGDILVFPHDQTLWDADPPFSAKLRPGETLDVGFFFTIAPSDPSRFTARQARYWLSQLDRCIEDEGGYVIALLLPDTHKLTVNVAPGSRFEVTSDGQTRLLVDNRGATPYALTFRPQDYPPDAVFEATRPFSDLVLHLPFTLRGKLTRK